MSGQPGRPSERELLRALVRFNARVLGITLAVLSGIGLVVATLVLVARDGPHPGQMLGQLRYFFPGYSVSVGGAWIGGLWAAIAGYALGWILGRAYGPWMVRNSGPAGEAGEAAAPGALYLRLRPLPLGLVTGLLLAAALVLATDWLWIRYGKPSPTLGLLRHYLPGYRTQPVGSLVGGAWLLLYGFLGASLTAWLYNRVLELRHPRAPRA